MHKFNKFIVKKYRNKNNNFKKQIPKIVQVNISLLINLIL